MTPEALSLLTPEQKRIRIAELLGVADRFVLIKRGLYWRHNAGGYTANINEAWILTEAEAEKYVHPHDEPTTKQRAPLPDYLPDYLNDLNAMHEAEGILRNDDKVRYTQRLENIVSKHVQSVGWSFALLHATAAQRADAFLLTIG